MRGRRDEIGTGQVHLQGKDVERALKLLLGSRMGMSLGSDSEGDGSGTTDWGDIQLGVEDVPHKVADCQLVIAPQESHNTPNSPEKAVCVLYSLYICCTSYNTCA